MTTEQKQANLAAAETALHNLMIGIKVVTASYAMGEGTRAVTYTPANADQLRGYIRDLKADLGLLHRRAIGIRF